MRIALDPTPLVLGIYAHVGELLVRTAERREDASAEELGKQFTSRRTGATDREVQQLVRSLHSGIKTADKLLKKTSDVWKISQETDLVELVVKARGQEPAPRSYVLIQPDDIRALLRSIANAARGAGEDEETIEQLERAEDGIEARPNEYLAFGFDPWGV